MRTLIALSGLALLLTACGPNTKNEQQAWDNLKKDAAEFKVKWPGFVAPIDAVLKVAEPEMAEALKVGDEKEKAKKMKAVNEKASVLISRLNEIKYKSEGIEKTITKLGELKLPKPQSNQRKEAMTAARNVLNEVEAGMQAAKPTNQEEAMAALEPLVGKLIEGAGAADRAYDKFKPKKAKKKKKKKK